MKIWIVTWHSWNSEDHGICGAWKVKPSEEAVRDYMKKTFPEEFLDETGQEYIHWCIEEMTVFDTIFDGSDIVTN
jgi:hypothetical protein